MRDVIAPYMVAEETHETPSHNPSRGRPFVSMNKPVEATETGLFARIQLAPLVRGHLDIPHDKRIVLEIGASDRDTLDQWLPRWNDSFLLTAEPLLDKYARGMARDKGYAGDQFQPLGRAHPNAIILPFAVGPSSTPVGVTKFYVGRNAGCSSALPLLRNSSRLSWCRAQTEQREVPLVTLERLLTWVGPSRPIDFIKVDAQGLDMGVIESAGPLLSRVRAFSVEVVSDICAPLYEGQPQCSEVMRRARALGFEPATPVHCRPKFGIFPRWMKSAWVCELDVLFVSAGADPRRYAAFHNLGLSGCDELSPLTMADARNRKLLNQNLPPVGKALMAGAQSFYSRSWRGSSLHSHLEAYDCIAADYLYKQIQ